MLDVGDKVPDFTLPLARADGRRERVAFSSLLGKGPVVVAFYPLAFTGVCTKELCELRDAQAQLDRLRATTVGFSVDTPQSNAAYAKAHALAHGLFSDPNREVVGRLWGTQTVAGVRDVAKRGWLVVRPDGVVAHRWVTEDPEIWSGVAPIEAALARLG
ncbi:MAG TPA: redoxin domain-containing protein [Candidatus Thermoplasmatota archaeon]|nr:redoxin domain-containing protein [Candidatus Thermoplasmatota archaeon]